MSLNPFQKDEDLLKIITLSLYEKTLVKSRVFKVMSRVFLGKLPIFISLLLNLAYLSLYSLRRAMTTYLFKAVPTG
jgi:hypothetical protein